MLQIDKSIYDVNDAICDNIKHFDATDRGLLSQNILSQLRNLVEYVAIKVYLDGKDINPNDYSLNTEAMNYMQRHGNFRFLYRFHEMLQKSVSHYTVDKDGSERLMLKYYEHLYEIKLFLWKKYGMSILDNINDFPLDTDKELSEYHEKIAEIVDFPSSRSYDIQYTDRCYVQKVKPFFTNQKIYYEVTFTTVNSNASKFDRVIAFTNLKIVDNYAVKFRIRNDFISIFGKEMNILVIDRYDVSIRPCEWSNLSKIFGSKIEYSVNSNEYKGMMTFLTRTGMSLTELVCSDEYYYNSTKRRIIANGRTVKIYDILDQCRTIITENKPGENVLRYLLYKMNNVIIQEQCGSERCKYLSNLFLKFGCIPFDNMPFCTSLVRHNPKLQDLMDSISSNNREHEFFARYIRNNTEVEGKLFTAKEDIEGFTDIDSLINTYNSSLYHRHERRKLRKYKDYIYIGEYVEDCTAIMRRLKELSSTGVNQYTVSVDSWLSKELHSIDDESKKDALRQMFSKSHVALIYGAAGTGKSTLIKYISDFWAKKDKIFLANTHPAVDNMRRKVVAEKSEYNTIAGFLSDRNSATSCDILIIDECSTVSNSDMRKVLEKAEFKLLVLVGDTYQIESIYFGNWFEIAEKFISSTSVFKLDRPFRTTNRELLTVWDRVRKLDDSILEPLVKNNCVSRLDDTIFEHDEKDEIILCLNYDGLYGINNINRFLQSNNPNKPFTWEINTYKVDDPILFNETNAFSPLIHNNSKGKIVAIHADEQQICFDIELEEAVNEIDALEYDFKLKDVSKEGKSIISFCVNKHGSSDEDDKSDDLTVVPFQVAYAVSIHKAQGLEYDSVKIIITSEMEERITHNIFYTAITRAKRKLKIYWSPETEQYVLSHLEARKVDKDAYLLSNLKNLEMV
ncbi:MAG: ATP-dependent RecD-like DNA helicase [Oscillospiraceae bacterium]|nr:ATP-dependent RecD-like DNA helicase [Oscillospiraceae bacterium]